MNQMTDNKHFNLILVHINKRYFRQCPSLKLLYVLGAQITIS